MSQLKILSYKAQNRGSKLLTRELKPRMFFTTQTSLWKHRAVHRFATKRMSQISPLVTEASGTWMSSNAHQRHQVICTYK